ncbi:MAG: tripartite tricarboxylate transporter substrate binding protein BugD [Pseudolabrys sp.]|nr:tripartite tricarboxylate transporter substrate binding protein BugD [Pseudolabrys sp.]MBV9954105.1 tripartite tricarboxylate transporter substrate binding protein BugD [Pseudolabrys sp.]
MRRRDFIKTMTAAAGAVALPRAVFAQNYPTRPVTMVVPFAAGGSFDVLGRVLTGRLSETMGQQIVVENVTGAAGIVGCQRVKAAQPDGYTFLLATIGTHSYNPSIYKKLPYDPINDFTMVGLFAEMPMVLVVNKDLPIKNLKEFTDYVKANEAKIQFGSAGVGSTTHLSCAMVNAAIHADPVHVPYRGGGPAMADIMGGRLQYGCSNIGGVVEQVKAGNLKGIATLARTRSKALPDLPTADEQGLKDFHVSTWTSFVFPKNTPEAIVKKLHDCVGQTIDTPQVIELLHKQGVEPVDKARRSPEYLAKFIQEDIKRWEGPIKAAHIEVDK